jgi:diguanylate cyclase (GGDEF)-like protein
VLVFTAAALVVARIHVGLKQSATNLSEKARHSEEKAARDPLTGLYQFHYIRERLAIEIERSKRYQTPLSCLMIDVDKLKEINDTLGHAAGDLVLETTATIFQRMVRMIDTATRYGGDEFLIILPVTNAQGAYLAGERLRRAVEKEEILFKGKPIKASISVGVGAFPSDQVHDLNSLLETADQNLYAAKKNGHNCTVGMPPAAQAAS